MKITQLLQLSVAAVAVLTAPMTQAQTFNGVFNYNTDDVVLTLFANTYDNVYFDIGPVSQFLNHTNGYQVQVTNWSPSVVEQYLGSFPAAGGSLTISFFLDAADNWNVLASTNLWVTDTRNQGVGQQQLVGWGEGVYDFGGTLTVLSENQISEVGPPQPGDVFATNYVVLTPAQKGAWDYKNNDDYNWTVVASINGPFETSIPGSIPFWDYNYNTKANTQIGTFQFTADGRLFYTVGTILDKAQITDVQYDGVSETDVSFNTKLGANYQLLVSTNLAAPLSAWTVVPKASVLGDGTPQTLSDYNATNSQAFYTVESH